MYTLNPSKMIKKIFSNFLTCKYNLTNSFVLILFLFFSTIKTEAIAKDPISFYRNDNVYVIPISQGVDISILSVQPFQFTGILNIGDGNRFINANIKGLGSVNQTLFGTLYFWTNNQTYLRNNYFGKDYAFSNLSGKTSDFKETGNNTKPHQLKSPDQEFFAHKNANRDESFRNSMKANADNSNFYKTNILTNSVQTLEKHRIWLNLTNASSANFSQALVGFIEGATDGFDPGYDGLYFGVNQHSIYSILNNESYTIQAFALPFEDTDVIPLGITTTESGTTTIAIDHVDGLFLGTQPIYLEDLLLNITYDIKTAPYVFESAIGTFNNRFLLRFNNSSLSTSNQNNLKNVIVYAENGKIKIKSDLENIKKVTVYDLLGRQIFENSNINNKDFNITSLKGNQTLIIKITLETGEIISKKIVNQ